MCLLTVRAEYPEFRLLGHKTSIASSSHREMNWGMGSVTIENSRENN
jgi:hypothetical protein